MTFSIADFFNRLTSSDTHSSVLPEDSLLKKNLLCVDSNAKRLHLVIPESFFNEYPGLEPNKTVESVLLTTHYKNTGGKGLRLDIAERLSFESNKHYLSEGYSIIATLFSDTDRKNFTLGIFPDIKKSIDSFSSASRHDAYAFYRYLQYLSAYHYAEELLYWILLFCFFQEDIIRLYKAEFTLHPLSTTQYHHINNFLAATMRDRIFQFETSQCLEINDSLFWQLRDNLIASAKGHLYIAGPTLMDAFSMSSDHSIVNTLSKLLQSPSPLTDVSVFLIDPILFDKYECCNALRNTVNSTISTLEDHLYALFENAHVNLHIYFLPLLQIDHAVITDEFMAFRSTKLWTQDRGYKGGFFLYLSDIYTEKGLQAQSEYHAHKAYLDTVIQNCTKIYPASDINEKALSERDARGQHMHWRQRLRIRGCKHIFLYKLYENQLQNYVSSTWGGPELSGMFTSSSTILKYESLFDAQNLLNDHTQSVLLPYIKETNKLFNEAIRKHDSTGYSRIFPSLDLGYPNNIQRLAGGFATGMLITWKCGIDMVPIDATVNVCTSSVFKLSQFDPSLIQNSEKLYERLESYMRIASDEKGYSFSFTSGNHFLIIAKEENADNYYLVLHSSANELKNSYMGLYPVEGNWYSDRYKIQPGENGRYFRYLKDADASNFIAMAHNFERYNEQIHRWLALQINNQREFSSAESIIKHHYYMPTDSSIAIGSFAEPSGTIVPIFSRYKKPIYLFQIGDDNWKVNLGEKKGNVCVIPHGWGQKIDTVDSILIKGKNLVFTMNDGTLWEKEITSRNRIDCIDKEVRDFHDGNEFLKIGSRMVRGSIVKRLIPVFEYSKNTIRGKIS